VGAETRPDAGPDGGAGLVRVTVELVGPLRRKPSPNPGEVLLPAGSTLDDLMSRLGYTPEESRHLIFLRGEERLPPGAALADGDRIEGVLHVGGG